MIFSRISLERTGVDLARQGGTIGDLEIIKLKKTIAHPGT